MKSCSSPPLRLGRPLWSILLFPRGRFMDASLHHAESGFQDSHEPLWAMSPQGGRERDMGPGRDSREKALEQRADQGLASKAIRTWLTQLSSSCQDHEGPAGVREELGLRLKMAA